MTQPDDPIPSCCVGIKAGARAPERFGVDPCDDMIDGKPARTWDVVERVSGTHVGNYPKRKDAREEAARRNKAAGAVCSDPETTAQPTSGEP